MSREPEPYLEVSVAEGDPAVVELAGELDIASVHSLEEALAGHRGDIELHCSGVTFFEAAGVSALVSAHKACVKRGAKLVVVNPSGIVLKVLALVELDHVLDIRSEERAL